MAGYFSGDEWERLRWVRRSFYTAFSIGILALLYALRPSVLTNLLFNAAARPDFIAYKFEDRDSRRCRRCIDRLGVQEVSWTIRSKADLLAAEAAGCIPIFECFDPDEQTA